METTNQIPKTPESVIARQLNLIRQWNALLLPDERKAIIHAVDKLKELEAMRDCLTWISRQPTDQLASATQCSMVAAAQDALDGRWGIQANAEVSDRRAHATEIKQDANGGSLH